MADWSRWTGSEFLPKECFEEFIEAEAGPGDWLEAGGGLAECFGEGGGLKEMMGLESAGSDQSGKLEGEAAGLPGGEGLPEGVVHVAGDDDALTLAGGRFGEEPRLVDSGLDDDVLGAFSGAEIGGGFAVDGEGDAGFAMKFLPSVFREGAGVFDEVDVVASVFGEGEEEVADGFSSGLLIGIKAPAELGMGGGDFAQKEPFGDEVAADFQLDGVEGVFEGELDGCAVEARAGEVAAGHFHFFEHPVFVETGCGVHLGAA